MAQPNISNLTSIAKSEAVKTAVHQALASIAVDLLQENATFPVKAQTKRYNLARQIIAGDTTPAVRAGTELLINQDSYFNTIPDSNTIKGDILALQINSKSLVEILAGVSALDLI